MTNETKDEPVTEHATHSHPHLHDYDSGDVTHSHKHIHDGDEADHNGHDNADTFD